MRGVGDTGTAVEANKGKTRAHGCGLGMCLVLARMVWRDAMARRRHRDRGGGGERERTNLTEFGGSMDVLLDGIEDMAAVLEVGAIVVATAAAQRGGGILVGMG